MKELISVIVPVYNVEDYIRRCLDSIISQTYKNLEIVLVDDGSKDNSGKICDEYTQKDNRIKVIHKENGGLSDARNKGIDIATGEYIMFVDSDDWIVEDSIMILYNALKNNAADISCGILKKVYNKNIKINLTKKNDESVFNKIDALEQLMYLHNFSNSANGKLYKMSLFKNIRYPINKHYEDLATTYKVFDASNKIVMVNTIIYYYFQNEKSIMHKKYSEKRLEGVFFAEQELEFIKLNYRDIVPSAIYRLFFECLCCISEMNFKCDDKEKILNIIKKYRKNVLKDTKLSKKQKLLCYSSFLGQIGIKIAFYAKEIRKK